MRARNIARKADLAAALTAPGFVAASSGDRAVTRTAARTSAGPGVAAKPPLPSLPRLASRPVSRSSSPTKVEGDCKLFVCGAECPILPIQTMCFSKTYQHASNLETDDVLVRQVPSRPASRSASPAARPPTARRDENSAAADQLQRPGSPLKPRPGSSGSERGRSSGSDGPASPALRAAMRPTDSSLQKAGSKVAAGAAGMQPAAQGLHLGQRRPASAGGAAAEAMAARAAGDPPASPARQVAPRCGAAKNGCLKLQSRTPDLFS